MNATRDVSSRESFEICR